MESFAQDLISLLQYLIPGLVSAWIFYSLTSFTKPTQFERVIQALIFTLISHTLVSCVGSLLTFIGEYWTFGVWGEKEKTATSLVMAVTLGVLASYCANTDKIHSFLRNKGITKETSYPSEWYGTFHKNITFVVLHLSGERRLYGWPIEWPSDPSKGHFLIADPSWLLDDGTESRISSVTSILISVTDVQWVEFLEKTWEKENGKESVKSSTT